jgi:tRNA A37 threonylcarbamoyladenosine dehydratase
VAVNPAFQRLQLLTGVKALELLHKTRAAVFGVGGVGGWCAEALVRSGIEHLTIIDSDVVCVTNINRQLQASSQTIGKSKTVELGRRLREINPKAEIIEVQKVYHQDVSDAFDLGGYEYVIDAIDSLTNKVELIRRASMAGAKVFTALGASGKLDPSRIKTGSLWDSHDCPLGKFVRKKLRQRGFNGEVTCVFSDEAMAEARDEEIVCGTGACHCPKSINGEETHEWCSSKKQINGSVVHITGIMGFMLAGLVVRDVIKRANAITINRPLDVEKDYSCP